MDPRFYVLTPAGLSGPYPNRYEAAQSARMYRLPVIVRKGERADDEPPEPCPMEDDTPCQPRALDYTKDYTIGQDDDE